MIMDRVFFSAATLGFYAPDYPAAKLPSDVVLVDGNLWRQILSGQCAGKIIAADEHGAPILIDPPAPTLEQTLQIYTAKIQARLDSFVQSRSYDSGVSCASYAASTNATFKSEANRFIELRDQTWDKCYAVMDDVTAGKRPMPTFDDLLLELPVLTWDSNA